MVTPAEGSRGRSFGGRDAAGYAFAAAAVWLAWQIVQAPIVDRGPARVAVGLAPTSPEVLRRAAEGELAADRASNAQALASESLARAPFNARALRVRGLAEAKLGSRDRADQMLTLAGNWSLRDDPTHAWLVEHRLRLGDYHSAFAHADTLVRRREEAYGPIFRLFTAAAIHDSRSIPHLTATLRANPPWRQSYLLSLHANPQGAPIAGAIALGLEPTEGRLTRQELQHLYAKWAESGRYPGIKELRRRTNRPSLSPALQNGDFSTDFENQFLPFGWRSGVGAGFSATLVEDDLRPGNTAYRFEYDGFNSGRFIEQLMLLEPGDYVLKGERRAETGQSDLMVRWHVICAETGSDTRLDDEIRSPRASTAWQPFEARFQVPRENCTAQWLRLESYAGERRMLIAAWLDNIAVVSAP